MPLKAVPYDLSTCLARPSVKRPKDKRPKAAHYRRIIPWVVYVAISPEWF